MSKRSKRIAHLFPTMTEDELEGALVGLKVFAEELDAWLQSCKRNAQMTGDN